MARITAITINPLSFPKIMGMGPINITPPVLTSLVLDEACSAVPTNTKMNPMKIIRIPAKMMVFPFIMKINFFI